MLEDEFGAGDLVPGKGWHLMVLLFPGPAAQH